MHDSRLVWPFAIRFPSAFAGITLHRYGLEAMHQGDVATADRLFEAAAGRYRVELAVESLARLRVHQRIARVRALPLAERGGDRVLEIEQALARLATIESLSPPFERIPARALLATWLTAEESIAEDAAVLERVA
jgi:hypothetical protein